MQTQTTARNAGLMDLSALLQTQQAAKYDVVVAADAIASRAGILRVGDDQFRPTDVCDEGIAEKLGVPLKYLRRLRAERPDLYDANVNGWLQGWRNGVRTHRQGDAADPDGRRFLVRTFKGGDEGIARAFLSDGYKVIDHLDVLTAALEGVRESGAHVEIDGCDLSERKMQVRLVAPEITALAPVLLRDYRSPFGRGADRIQPWDTAQGLDHGWLRPDDRPIVFAGVVLSNSETGGGAFTLTPRIVVLACRNGLTITGDALRNVHLGARMEEGVVRWSEQTQEANLALVKAQAKDAMTTFLDSEYVIAKVREIEQAAGVPVTNPEATIREVTKRLRISEERTVDVLAHFIMGGSLTAGGVMQAVTSVAQTVADPDQAADLEGLAFRALNEAALVAA